MTKKKLTGAMLEQHPMEDIVQVRLMRLNEVINQIRRHSVGAVGLRSTDLRILNILYDVESVSINELARRAHVDKAWISRSVNCSARRNSAVSFSATGTAKVRMPLIRPPEVE